jgi:death-on-curing protein
LRYISVTEVAAINESEVGPNLLGDFGLLESAVMRPQQSVFGEEAYPDIHSKAGALFHSLCRNHPFIDGNKRTAVLALVIFYELNSYSLSMEQGEMVGLAVDTAEGQLDVAAIAGILKQHVARLDLPSD